jgi:hypothetical protein
MLTRKVICTGLPLGRPNVCLGLTFFPFVSDVDLFSSSIRNVSCCCYQKEWVPLDYIKRCQSLLRPLIPRQLDISPSVPASRNDPPLMLA